MENITRIVSNIQSMNQQIVAAAEQQSAVAEEISRSIINVRDVSDRPLLPATKLPHRVSNFSRR